MDATRDADVMMQLFDQPLAFVADILQVDKLGALHSIRTKLSLESQTSISITNILPLAIVYTSTCPITSTASF
ncbi:hypothetical protein HAX54_002013, partial [Datura stramonium]|nr:hypothetical protein [Datura stramonium]